MKTIRCPECSVICTAAHHLQTFCTKPHQQAFHDRNAARGKIVLPFVIRVRQRPRGTDDYRYAVSELSRLGDKWAAEDRLAGRRTDLIVSRKRRAGWTAADLEPKPLSPITSE